MKFKRMLSKVVIAGVLALGITGVASAQSMINGVPCNCNPTDQSCIQYTVQLYNQVSSDLAVGFGTAYYIWWYYNATWEELITPIFPFF